MSTAGPILIVEDLHEVGDWLAGLVAQVYADAPLLRAANLAVARAAGREAGAALQLVLVDLGLPDGSGIALIRELHEAHPALAIVVTTVHDDDANLFGALAAGAIGYLLKDQPDAILLHQLRRQRAGEPPLTPRMARRILEYFHRPPSAPLLAPDENSDIALTARETDVLACIGRGMRVSEAARQLGLAENTVSSYIKSLYGKLSIRSRAEAALEAARRGLT